MAVDLETVTLMSSYRVGFLPPAWGSLAPGELYIEIMPPDKPGSPQLWVGAPDYAEAPGGAMSLVPTGLVLEPPPVVPDEPPVNVDVPAVTPIGTAAVGDTLNCTMGNWDNEPTDYRYYWLRDGATGVGTDTSYTTVEADLDHAITCIVTASNAIGATEGPPSNEVLVEAPVSDEARSADPPAHRNKRK
jgi:hypothetical protein